ncbi:hypothetical protein GON26_05100 [Flavobacterium sp. GA093]|uniref:Uncharacterized protein n=1 Tax=Flavobacterium hydrocarbonoxydans TaxID=2683249 RepID=A0A6I4NRL3_9FLAO|nr:hypothetical protein [Flavobacterium hydrocarbonoxydans]MWB93727.1 hypothetical protein [Flavobacterium hydrocarbonoxydans]
MPSLEKILEFEFNDLKPAYKAFFIMLFSIGIICIVLYSSSEVTISKGQYKDMFEDNFSGLIVKKYIDYDNRKSPTFKFKDSSRLNGYLIFWEKVEIGDSISKNAKSRFVKIFKKDTVIVFDMNVEFKYYDTIPENKNHDER